MNTTDIGRFGERSACEYLKSKKYKIIKQNFFASHNEIDIIAENSKYIVFVEVKTRKQNSMVSGVQAVDAYKQRRITLTANDYIVKTECRKQPRFDIAEVTVFEKEDNSVGYKLHYMENVW